MTSLELVRKQQEYEKRHALLQVKYPPLNAFVLETLPYPGRNGEVVFRKALTLKREWSSEHYQMKLTERSPEDRKDCQVVVIPPSDPNNRNKDFSEEFFNDIKNNQLGKHPVARLERQDYNKDTGDIGRYVIDKKKVKTVFIVASIVDDHDYLDVIHVASEYRQYGEDVEINLVSPFIKGERDDKSVEIIGKNKKKKHTGKIVSILPTMRSLSPFINNIYTYETHSSATQSFAAMFGMDLVPISLQDELIGKIKENIMDPREWCIVRPDSGRNMVARRISNNLKIKGVSLSKIRKGDTTESESAELTDSEARVLIGKNILLYDDEGATFRTVKDITINHLLKAKVKSINILLGHGRLQKGWDENLKKMINACKEKDVPFKMYISNSRMPLADLKGFIEKNPNVIEIVSVAEKTRKVIEAAINGVNFFHDDDWALSILQPIDGYDFNTNYH